MRKSASYFDRYADLTSISGELSKVLADLCKLPESDMYLQVLQAIDELKEQEWYP
ncbi:MAG: hypothetical protein GQ576_00385 [Methanococcoides sp.]|nr:hypothetical protein [Methanococcoides sp.]